MDQSRLNLTIEQSKLFPKQPKVLAVTGTNGKTSVVDYIRQIFEFNNISAASIGSLGCILKGYDVKTKYIEPTLPGPKSLYKLLDEISPYASYAAIEATSHGLQQYRMHAVKVEVAGFTNLTQDHLDYHGTMHEYFKAKTILFKEILKTDNFAVYNKSSSYFKELVAIHPKHMSYGTMDSDIYATNIKNSIYGISYDLMINGEKIQREDDVFGDFQIENILCALSMCCLTCNVKYPRILSPKGRLEKVKTLTNGSVAFVDHAHTPDALKKSIIALKGLTSGRIIVVFGCGGDRDKTKRPIMGEIASDLCDITIITDDNPRFENPHSIRQEIIKGCKNKIYEIGDRRNAIIFGLNQLNKNDILLVAGKGHETTQTILDEKIHFSDQEIILNA